MLMEEIFNLGVNSSFQTVRGGFELPAAMGWEHVPEKLSAAGEAFKEPVGAALFVVGVPELFVMACETWNLVGGNLVDVGAFV